MQGVLLVEPSSVVSKVSVTRQLCLPLLFHPLSAMNSNRVEAPKLDEVFWVYL